MAQPPNNGEGAKSHAEQARPDIPLGTYTDRSFPAEAVASITERMREDARTRIAYIIVGSLAFIVLATFATIWLHAEIKSADDIVKIVQAVLSPVAGIVGAVMGFYFGARQAQPVADRPGR
jgi:hypothetical protein